MTLDPTSTATAIAEPVFGLTVLAIPDGCTLDTWAALGTHLRAAVNSTPWWVGDWLVYAHTHFETDHNGDPRSDGAAAVRRHLADLGFEHDTVERCRRVAAKFPPAARHDELTWAHHLEVTPLDADQAERLLVEAAAEGWSTRDLREHVRRAQAIDTTGQDALPGLAKPVRLSVKLGVVADRALLDRAAERITAVLTELGLDGEVKVA